MGYDIGLRRMTKFHFPSPLRTRNARFPSTAEGPNKLLLASVFMHPLEKTGSVWRSTPRSVRSATKERTQKVKAANDITISQAYPATCHDSTYESIGYEAALPIGSHTATHLWFGYVGADDARREVPEVALIAMVIGNIHRRLHRKCCR